MSTDAYDNVNLREWLNTEFEQGFAKTVVNHVLILELNSKHTVGVEMLQSQVRGGAGELPEKLGGVSFPLPKT